MSTRGAGPLNWRTGAGFTPEIVRQGRYRSGFPKDVVVAMLDAADEAHIKRLNEENEIGGQARRVVGDVAVPLGVVLGDTGPRMSVWDPANMRRVVAAAKALRDDRNGWEAEADNWRQEAEKLRDLLRSENERANAAIRREEVAEEHFEEKDKECEALREAVERAEAKLRKIEHGCETPESHSYGCPCVDEPIKFRGGSITLQQDPMTAEIRFDLGPWDRTTWFIEETDPEISRHGTLSVQRERRTVGVRIDGSVWGEFLRAASTVDPSAKVLRDELAALHEAYSDRIGRHIETYAERDELKATIVSQAREIARLKGESA